MIQVILLVGIFMLGLRFIAFIVDIFIELLEIFFSSAGQFLLIIIVLLIMVSISLEDVIRLLEGLF